jgi:hypothetical protein
MFTSSFPIRPHITETVASDASATPVGVPPRPFSSFHLSAQGDPSKVEVQSRIGISR